MEARFEILLRSFGRFVDICRLDKKLIIDMAFYTYNSTFENDEPDETRVDLELIRIARRWLEENA